MALTFSQINAASLNNAVSSASGTIGKTYSMEESTLFSVHTRAIVEGSTYPVFRLEFSGSNQNVIEEDAEHFVPAIFASYSVTSSAASVNHGVDLKETAYKFVRVNCVPSASTAGFVDIFFNRKG